MKVGDLVKLDIVCYPLQHEVGVLINVPRPLQRPRKWAVMVGGKIHPYTVEEQDMAVINESR
jgi:hypothetical protein